MTDHPAQPWAKEKTAGGVDALERAIRELNESAERRHKTIVQLLIFLPLIWGAISAVLWFIALSLGYFGGR